MRRKPDDIPARTNVNAQRHEVRGDARPSIATGGGCEEAGTSRVQPQLGDSSKLNAEPRGARVAVRRRPAIRAGRMCTLACALQVVACHASAHPNHGRAGRRAWQPACLRCHNVRAKPSLKLIRSVEAHASATHDVHCTAHQRTVSIIDVFWSESHAGPMQAHG
jgi:hypothetical protein